MSIHLKSGESFVQARHVFDVACTVLSSFQTDVADKAAWFIGTGDFDSYLGMEIDSTHYRDAATFIKDYQAVSLLRKAEFLPSTFDKERNARKVFWDAEKSCAITNKRFERLSSQHAETHAREVSECGDQVLRTLMRAQHLVRKILGPVPKRLDFHFGPGSTSLVRRGVTLPKKYTRTVHVTPELYSYWRDICGPTWCKTITDVQLVAGSSVSFVPKDAKKHRSICVEPHLNIYAQLGVGSHMRRRFKPWVDLTVGQDRNRYLASIAHKERLATVDFSAASDTISRGVVSFLLSDGWCQLLDSVRSHRFLIDDEEHVFEKHSSMGNGYTFELESILFYALAYSTCDELGLADKSKVSSYGDDVILPQEAAALYERVCTYCGFKVNTEKSFLEGSFFESCGHDYFDGVNVRPFLIRKLNPITGFKLHNDIRRLSKHTLIHGTPLSEKLEGLALDLRQDTTIPSKIKLCLIPDGYGNAGFVVPFDQATPDVTWRGWDGFRTLALKYVSAQQQHSGLNGMLASLDRGGQNSRSDIRGRGYCTVSSLNTFGEWLDFGHGNPVLEEIVIDEQLGLQPGRFRRAPLEG